MADAQISKNSATLTGNIEGGGSFTVSVNVIPATEDRVRAVLHQKLERLNDGPKSLAWLGIAVTILLTLSTADFKISFGLEPTTLKAAFVISLVISIILAVFFGGRYLSGRKEFSIDAIVKALKNTP